MNTLPADKPRQICVVTGSRAEYGLLKHLLQAIHADPQLDLQLVVTGSHLSPEFGLTYQEIVADGFEINVKVESLTSSDTAIGVSTSIGLGLIRFADVLAGLKPDLMLVLGDRYEIFAAVVAALITNIPVAHLHGGETTEGAFDEAIRHAITKMAHLHFVAAAEYQQRVIQLGEQPAQVFLVGGLGVDNIHRCPLLARDALEASLNLKFAERNLLITFHPVTLEQSSAGQQMAELLAALAPLADTQLIFTLPNADTDGRIIIDMIQVFVRQHANAHCFSSLGQLRYFSTIAQVDAVLGNSSSGLAEVPSFHKATINIGSRQQGRLKARSVIDCAANSQAITAAIQQVYRPEFQQVVQNTINPYGQGGAVAKILTVLKSAPLTELIKKQFYDLAGHF